MRIETIGNATLYEGECLALMAKLPDASVDMILCDLPYGTTACKWDTVIPFEPLWAQYRRVAKRNAAIVLTASQPFTTALIASNMREFRYCWVWDKALPTGHLNAKRQPLRVTEDVAVFYREQPTYVPQKTSGHKRKVAARSTSRAAMARKFTVRKVGTRSTTARSGIRRASLKSAMRGR